jgi:hypothetical protein
MGIVGPGGGGCMRGITSRTTIWISAGGAIGKRRETKADSHGLVRATALRQPCCGLPLYQRSSGMTARTAAPRSAIRDCRRETIHLTAGNRFHKKFRIKILLDHTLMISNNNDPGAGLTLWNHWNKRHVLTEDTKWRRRNMDRLGKGLALSGGEHNVSKLS